MSLKEYMLLYLRMVGSRERRINRGDAHIWVKKWTGVHACVKLCQNKLKGKSVALQSLNESIKGPPGSLPCHWAAALGLGHYPPLTITRGGAQSAKGSLALGGR